MTGERQESGEWIVPTDEDYWRLAIEEEASGLQEEGGRDTLEPNLSDS